MVLHKGLLDAFEEDEELPASAKKYGVRDFADWKATGDALEAELGRRGLAFDPVPWSQPALPKDPARVFYYGNSASPGPGEVYVVQPSFRGPFFVERLPPSGLAVQMAGPFVLVQAALIAAARY